MEFLGKKELQAFSLWDYDKLLTEDNWSQLSVNTFSMTRVSC